MDVNEMKLETDPLLKTQRLIKLRKIATRYYRHKDFSRANAIGEYRSLVVVPDTINIQQLLGDL